MHSYLSRAAGRGSATAVAALLATLVLSICCDAATVVLRIEAGNPLDVPKLVQIRSKLPPRVGTNDIVSLDGLELGYDIRNDVYYVHRDIELGPKDTVQYNVRIRDIWTIPMADLDRLRSRVNGLSELLADADSEDIRETASALRSVAIEGLDRIRATQAENTIQLVKPIMHIRAYDENVKRLGQVKRFIARLENLALGLGKDPGPLMGEVEISARPRLQGDAAEEAGEAVIRITVHNPSVLDRENVPFQRQLPPEIGLSDVLNADGLEVGVDPDTGASYVYKNDLAIGAGETKVFNVRVRDRWNSNAPRIRALKAAADDIRGRIGRRQQFDSVVQAIEEVQGELAALAAQQGPEVLNEEYVAFYRAQAARLDGLDRKLARIEDAIRPLQPRQKWGFEVEAPSRKTTWLIIYIVLGFLALVSLLFFFRWYGRTGQEVLAEQRTASGSEES